MLTQTSRFLSQNDELSKLKFIALVYLKQWISDYFISFFCKHAIFPKAVTPLFSMHLLYFNEKLCLLILILHRRMVFSFNKMITHKCYIETQDGFLFGVFFPFIIAEGSVLPVSTRQ